MAPIPADAHTRQPDDDPVGRVALFESEWPIGIQRSAWNSPRAEAAAEPRQRSLRQLRDATLLSVMYGAGLRPGEALALRDDSVRERIPLVES